jgi:hypothetical protein
MMKELLQVQPYHLMKIKRTIYIAPMTYTKRLFRKHKRTIYIAPMTYTKPLFRKHGLECKLDIITLLSEMQSCCYQ